MMALVFSLLFEVPILGLEKFLLPQRSVQQSEPEKDIKVLKA